uniref:Uncharacterized protein n=1 Tax=Acrobeloides nanus TaxID=290746 RepID=A0A914DXS3_9BILA
MEDAYVMERGHIASPVRSSLLPPAQTLFNDPSREMVPFGQISSPPPTYATENVYLMPYGVEHTEYSVGQQENWQSNSDFDNTSSPPASQFSGSETSSFEESGSELAEFLDPIIDSEKAANPKVATKMVCKKVCRKNGQVGKRGRPRDPNKNNKKNTYMQTYHQKVLIGIGLAHMKLMRRMGKKTLVKIK